LPAAGAAAGLGGKRSQHQSDEGSGGNGGDLINQEAWMVLFQAARAARHGFEQVRGGGEGQLSQGRM
jgi:hypothetical protein